MKALKSTRVLITSTQGPTEQEWRIMSKYMSRNRGIGIAAPQLGIQKRACIVAAHKMEPIYMVNPGIIDTKGEYETIEACLSLPGQSWAVKRHKVVDVIYIDGKSGKTKTRTFRGEQAQIVQHEIDHMNGIMIDSGRGLE